MNELTLNHRSDMSGRPVLTLIDGRELPIILKGGVSCEQIDDTLKLDTSGEFFSISEKPKTLSESDAKKAERQYNHHLFTENAWFLLDNAEVILSDSRMFLAPVNVQNGLAYIGTSGFKHPTLGVYLEWWLNYKEVAIDDNGNLVWYISGTPLSGRNCCSSVTQEGKQVKIAQRTSFSEIWRSFMLVNNRYSDAKQQAEAFSLEEVILQLRGEGYRLRILELKHEMIQKVMKWNYENLSKIFESLNRRLSKNIKTNRKMQLEANKEAILEFAKGYFAKEAQYKSAHDLYLKSHKELKRQLKAGTLKGDYEALLVEAGREYRTLKRELSDMGYNFLHTMFGKNPNEISLSDLLHYAKSRL